MQKTEVQIWLKMQFYSVIFHIVLLKPLIKEIVLYNKGRRCSQAK